MWEDLPVKKEILEELVSIYFRQSSPDKEGAVEDQGYKKFVIFSYQHCNLCPIIL